MKFKKEIVLSLVFLLVLTTVLLASFRTYYQINPARCNSCLHCVSHCATNAIYYNSSTHRYAINPDLCTGDGECVAWCGRNAIYPVTVDNNDVVDPGSLISVKAYPNPVKEQTSIQYTLPKNRQVGLIRIINVKGQVISSYKVEAGAGSIIWKGTGENGKKVPSGIYYMHLTSGKERIMRKITVVK